MYRRTECPACHSKLKYQGERSSIVCPRCKKRFAVATEQLAPTQQPSSARLSTLSRPNVSGPPLLNHKSSSNSYGIFVGIGLGGVATMGIVCAIIFFSGADTEPRTDPEQIEESAVVVATDSAPTLVAQAVEQPIRVAEKKTERNQLDQKPTFQAAVETTKDSESPNSSVETSLRYRWKVGQRSDYEFQLIANPPNIQQTLKGTCTYSVAKVATQLTEEELTGTGSGFVVSQDGYLVTCAHVVQDAKRIKVFLGDQQWEGKVVAVDQVQDLALLHVEAQGLPALPISNASEVELAEPVRVVGFPLSDMLGKGIKVTSGTVAGRTEKDESGARSFQVDASINPGNSGGPIIDEWGRVVGVASALFSGTLSSGIRVSEVGFAVPAEEVRRLLKRAHIPTTGTLGPKPKSGPELARRVTPSVAYLEVMVDPEVRQAYRVDFDFRFTTKKAPQKKPSSIHNFARAGLLNESLFPTVGKGSFAITQFGLLSKYQGKEVFPYAMDPIGALVIENLEHDGKSSWSSSTITTIRLQEQGGRFPAPRHLDHMQFRSLLEPKTTTHPAIERVSYEATHETSTQVTITKTYEFQTLEENDPPLFHQKGTGTIVFDKKMGMPVSLDYEATVSQRMENGSVVSVPYTLSYKKLDTDEVIKKKVLDAVATSARVVGAAMAKDSERKFGYKPRTGRSQRTARPEQKNNPQRVDELIAILKPSAHEFADGPDLSEFPDLMPEHSPNHRHFHSRLHDNRPSRSTELRELATMSVIAKRQRQVGQIFMHYAIHGDTFDQSAAAQGLVRWATKKQVSAMVHLLTKEVPGIDWPERQKIIQALSRFKSPQVYRAIASRLIEHTEQRDATKALVGFGSDAEKVVCEMLDHKSDEARGAAAEILEKIGTRKSLAPLKKALREEPDVFARHSIEDAIDAIRRR